MPEINKNNFSKFCRTKEEWLKQELRKQILEGEFMSESKFPIIYASDVISQCNSEKADLSMKESIKGVIQGIFCSPVAEVSVAGITALMEKHIKEFDNLERQEEKTLKGYAIAVDSFAFVRIDYRIWAYRHEERYAFAVAGVRGVLNVRRTDWNEFLNAYTEILRLGFPEDISQEEKQKQMIKYVEKAQRLFKLFKGELAI
ncbi:hypothetical protein [Blautia sp. Marseille-P3201T]|uniref:hypothetical protein n=1 Tax=Blautia sp. Marseille-P3201T TaxID=1907659 RepID=UPI000931A3F8|nr:hypothetical protein [Blautia sp. Marseille-P3201T]